MSVKVNKDVVNRLCEEAQKDLPDVLMPKIECIHPGATRNHNVYLSEKLRGDFSKRSGVYSWTYPYPKPMCYDHDTSSVRNISGRIINAQYITNGATGREAVVIIPKITNKEDIRRILNGDFLTVSIGAQTDSAICSICGKDVINEEWCGHVRGEVYDGKVCEYIIGDVWFNECSWVIVPADPDAKVVDVGVVEMFAQVGDDVYNISKEEGVSKLSKAAMLTEGLITDDSLTKVTENDDQDKIQSEGIKVSEGNIVGANITSVDPVTNNKTQSEGIDASEGSIVTAKIIPAAPVADNVVESIRALEGKIDTLYSVLSALVGMMQEFVSKAKGEDEESSKEPEPAQTEESENKASENVSDDLSDDDKAQTQELSKDEFGTGDAIEIDNSRDSANMSGTWGDVDKTSLRNKLLKASNYRSLVKEAYLVVEDRWEDAPSKHLKYPHHQVKDGKLVLHLDGCRVAWRFLQGHDPNNARAKRHLLRHLRVLGEDMSKYESLTDFDLMLIEQIEQEERLKAFMIEKILDYEVKLNKIDESASQKEKANLTEKSVKELDELLVNLTDEYSKLDQVSGLINSVKNPGLGYIEGNNPSDIVKNVDQPSQELDPIEILKKLFTRN